MIKFILRVDDVGRTPWDDPEEGTDHDLSYFDRWRKESGLAGLPAVYGIVVSWINPNGLQWMKNNIRYPEKVAVHGYDHKRGAIITPSMMAMSMDTLTTDSAPYSYIPPFNAYSNDTLHDWQSVGGKYFFGGFHGEHHEFADIPLYPPSAPNVIHIPATRVLYGHAPEIIHNLSGTFSQRSYPRVVTLHVPWDRDISLVKSLVGHIKDHLVPVDTLDALDIGRLSHHGC